MNVRSIASTAPLLCLLASGCNDHDLKSVKLERRQDSCSLAYGPDDGPEGADALGFGSFRCSAITIPIENRVDLLFVVDQNAAGQAWQLELADAMPRLVDALAKADPAPDVHIGIVGAQGRGNQCAAGPHLAGSGGVFSSTSCLQRPSHFSSAEVFESACAARCESSEGADGLWFSFAPGVTPDPAALADQLRCAAVLGDTGCPLSQPFGSTFSVTQRTAESGQFFRGSAVPVVVMVSGADDCTPDTSGVLDSQSTPAHCWNAGAACVEDESNAWNCEAKLEDHDGLVPVTRLLHWMERQSLWARQLGMGPGHLALWMGWEPGTVAPGPVLAHPPGTTESNDSVGDGQPLGVAPSCRRGESVATPPVRAAAVWEHAEEVCLGNPFDMAGASLCEGDLGPAMDALAKRVTDAVAPGCMQVCVADEDETLPGLQPECEFEAVWYEDAVGQQDVIEVCERDGNGGFVIPEGSPGCVDLRTDARLDPRCEERGSNLNVALHWRGPRPENLSLLPTCSVSKSRATDCPWPD